MRKALFVSAALGLAVSGCKTMDPQPESPAGTASSTSLILLPTTPVVQTIPDIGPVPVLPRSSHAVVTLCERTGAYAAAGVDAQARRITFVLKGGRLTQAAALSRLFAAHIPVTVYTAPVRVQGRAQTPAPVPQPLPPAPAPNLLPPDAGSGRDSGGDGDADPCNVPISDDTKGAGKPGGDEWLPIFLDLTWKTVAVTAPVIRPIELSTTTGAH
jgi:hypothetical protein